MSQHQDLSLERREQVDDSVLSPGLRTRCSSDHQEDGGTSRPPGQEDFAQLKREIAAMMALAQAHTSACLKVSETIDKRFTPWMNDVPPGQPPRLLTQNWKADEQLQRSTTAYKGKTPTPTQLPSDTEEQLEIISLEPPSSALQMVLENDLDRMSFKRSTSFRGSPAFRRHRKRTSPSPDAKYREASQEGGSPATIVPLEVTHEKDTGNFALKKNVSRKSFMSRASFASRHTPSEDVEANSTPPIKGTARFALKKNMSRKSFMSRASFASRHKPDKGSEQKTNGPPPPLLRSIKHHRLSVLLESSETMALESSFPEYFLHPQSRVYQYWHATSATAVVYIAILLPLRMGFVVETSTFGTAFEVLLDLFFMIDVLLCFRTAYVDTKTKLVISDPKQVASRYLHGWFVVDLLSSIPIELLSLAVDGAEDVVIFKVLRFLKLFRVSRLMRLDFITELEHKGVLAPSFIRIVKLLVIFFFVLHLITCFFWIILSDTPPSEMTGSWGNIGEEAMASPLANRYLLGLYWALAVSLGNDFSPDDNTQRLYSILIITVGVFLYAVIVGSASALMSNLDHNKAMQKRQMDDVNYYMMFHKVTPELQNKIREYYEYQFSQGIGGQSEAALFHNLSAKWTTKLQVAVKAKFIQSVPIFGSTPPQAIEALVLKLTNFISLPNEAAITQGQVGQEMYFINRGTVQAIISEGGEDEHDIQHVKVATLGPGMFFGEIALFDRTKPYRNASIISITCCNFFKLELRDFEKVLQSHPEMHEAMEKNIIEKRRSTETMKKNLVKQSLKLMRRKTLVVIPNLSPK
jgi:CRP-like cAMP-binding protein